MWKKIREILAEHFTNFYDYRPGSVDYPFVHLAEDFVVTDRRSKDYRDRIDTIVVHFWHDNVLEMGTLRKMMEEAELLIEPLSEDVSRLVLTDRSTGVDLLHGIMEIRVRF